LKRILPKTRLSPFFNLKAAAAVTETLLEAGLDNSLLLVSS
jgi:hypothetical protein